MKIYNIKMSGYLEMRKIFFIVISSLFWFSVINAQTVKGNFRIIQSNNSEIAVNVQLGLQQGTAVLGNAVIRLNFNNTVLAFPQSPIKNIDYIIHNLDTSYYYSSVSLSSPGVVSINIAQVGSNYFNLSSNYIDIATIYFKLDNPNDSLNIKPELLQFFSPVSPDEWTIGTWNVNYTITGITQNQPSQFELSQNYPNPFNPSTIISYSIPISSNVIIKLYNSLGEEMSTLVNDFQSPGKYKVQFNGSSLASGIYFYEIQAGSFTETKKMILLK